ncbi:hypothetical protein FW774_11235 [Pedobacter sp. BS3]|uniref:DUF5723 family protein n=1 Tax=Pedobacter sp. BS3 TaxID=2567937 RepID=UPI0011ECE9A3|nr:DUF5723 family protein [Pedobacter sp. BS3]TZF84011.1 hypothetical protein FW774_11235 [Pedobacter sp. BS3]
MKKLIMLSIALAALRIQAQQFSLYNTRTLYDAFENPSQKAFYADSSRKYAFNFLIPNIGVNAAFSGPVENTIRTLFSTGKYSTTGLVLGQEQSNQLISSSNNYIAMFRIFKTVKYNRELGFAWQVREDVNMHRLTNETFALLDKLSRFNGTLYPNTFNNAGYAQLYHQFSISYRENYDRKLALGVKLSYLSGVAFNQMDIQHSSIQVDNTTNSLQLYLDGSIKRTFNYENPEDDINLKPGFRNPGIAITTSASYKFNRGWFLLGNLKDIGFIHWSKQARSYRINDNIDMSHVPSTGSAKYVLGHLDSAFNTHIVGKGFNSMINGKAEVLISNDNIDNYQPSLLISKNLFYKGMDIALINRLMYKNWNFGISAAFNPVTDVQLGGMVMYKTPNFELFTGTDNIVKTVNASSSVIKQDAGTSTGYMAGSFYFGFSFKFGPDMEHQANANTIPGIGKDADKGGFFRRLFGKKEKTTKPKS